MANDIIRFLADHWDDLTKRVGSDPKSAILAFGDIVTAYREPHRAYHSLSHIADLMEQVKDIPFEDPISVKLAIFYHDIIYRTDPATLGAVQQGLAARDEELSAIAAEDDLETLGFPQSTIDRVAQLIRLTASHKADPADRDAALFLDLDMSIIGSDPERYGLYASQIRTEFARIDPSLFSKGRSAFVNGVLGQPRIFLTDEFESKCGKQARENLHREKTVLDANGNILMLRQLTPKLEMP